MELVCCCLSQVFFFRKNLFHLITTLRCSNIDQDSQPNTPTHPAFPTPPHTPTKEREKRKIAKEGNSKRGEVDLHPTTPRTTTHPLTTPLIPRTTPTPHTKGRRKKGKEKGSPFVCG